MPSWYASLSSLDHQDTPIHEHCSPAHNTTPIFFFFLTKHQVDLIRGEEGFLLLPRSCTVVIVTTSNCLREATYPYRWPAIPQDRLSRAPGSINLKLIRLPEHYLRVIKTSFGAARPHAGPTYLMLTPITGLHGHFSQLRSSLHEASLARLHGYHCHVLLRPSFRAAAYMSITSWYTDSQLNPNQPLSTCYDRTSL